MAKLLFICFIFILTTAYCAKILGVFPAPSHSHYTLGVNLMKELADRGHEVTFINPFPQKTLVKNNFKEVSVEDLVHEMKKHKRNMFGLEEFSTFNMLHFYTKVSGIITEFTFKQKEVQDLLKSNSTFDVVIVQNYLNEALMGFGYHFKAPVIVFCPMGSSFWINHLTGNPAPTSYVPNLFTKYSQHMTFTERLLNTFHEIVKDIYRELEAIPKQNEILKKYIPNAPHIKNIMYNASLVLLNSHISTNTPRPHFPNVIEIGGFHVGKPKKLPEDLLKFLDNAEEGVVLLCMGSNLKLFELPNDKQEAIFKSFAKLKQKVLLKWETDIASKVSTNVRVEKWLPQRDILAHPNILAFISHGGLLSTIEAIYNGVPMIGIPIFGDQKTNIATAVENGYAVSVPFQELTEKKLSWALNEILNNPKYREMAKMRSEVMHDQPVKQIDSAVYWIEYVIRHRGATHFKSSSLDLTWYQRSLLDVVIFSLAALVILVFIFIKFCHATLRLFKREQKIDVNSLKKIN